MKRIISALLVVVMLFSLAIPAFSAINIYETRSQIPVIHISGDGNTIYNKDGEALSKFGAFIGNRGEQTGSASIAALIESAGTMYKEYLFEGLLKDNWEPFYDAIQTEVSKYFGEILLDENGEATNGTHISQSNTVTVDKKEENNKGYYGPRDYDFWYDWRLDPYEVAEDFNQYVQDIKKVTGAEKVSIIARCLGSNVVCAYLTRYGTDDIYGVGFDGVVCAGAEPLSESMSGQFKVDMSSIKRLYIDAENFDRINLDPIVLACIELVDRSGLVDGYVAVKKATLYEKLVKGVTSALVLSSVAYPCYWACVKYEDFDTALEYVFGEEGSEKRVKYAGLIEKITRYNEVVKKNIPSLVKSLPEKGVKVAIISKYGSQLVPTCKSATTIADSFVSVNSSSFGATTGTIYETLSDEYIAAQTEKGLGKYISPDKQIDASTCLLPDYTWFVKGVAHSNWTEAENMLLMTVITNETQLTVDDLPETQFMVQDPNYKGRMIPMTEENCHTEPWTADEETDHPTSSITRVKLYFEALTNFSKELLRVLKEKAAESKAAKTTLTT